MVIDIKYAILACCVGFIVGVVLGRLRPKNMNIYEFIRKIYINLDNFVLLFSALIVTGSIYFSASGKMESFASVAINLFGSMVFSWLLTKKSSRVEFKQQEEKLALRSFRHINYIDSAANTAYKKIEQYLESNTDLDDHAKLMLSSAMDQIKYIHNRHAA